MDEFRDVDGPVDAFVGETDLEMFDAESSRRSRHRVVAVLVAVALVAGVGGLAYAVAGGDAGVVDTGPLTTQTVAAVPAATPDGHMVPLWLPERLVLRNASEEGAQPCATTPAVGSTTAKPAIQAGPGVCVLALTVLYYAPSIPSDGFVRFVEARATDVRTPLMTEATTVRGKRGALYRSRTGPSPSGPSLEALSLFWQEDADTTLFIDSVGLTLDEVLRIADSVTRVDDKTWASLLDSIPPPPAPSGPPDWQNGTELARSTLPSGEVVRFVETIDHTGLCILKDGPVACIGLGLSRPGITSPQFAGPGGPAGFMIFLLPEGYASQFTVRDETGATPPWARSSDGRVLIILDPDGPAAPTTGPPPARPARSFDLVGVDGQVINRVSSPAFSVPGPTSPQADPTIELVACLRSKGLDVPSPTTGPPLAGATPAQLYPSETARAAWQSCRDVFVKATGMPADRVDEILAFPDCMAGQGWIVVVMTGPPPDLAAYNAASEKCQWQSPSTKAVVTCLRSKGLDIPDPASGPITAPSMQPFAPETARAAWQGCRDVFVKATGMPGDRVDEILAFPDCMASQGWIVVIMTGPPTNQTDYAAASQNCGQTRG